MKKNDKPSSRDSITERIKTLLAGLDMKPLHLANKAGIDNAIIYKCLGGKRNWNLDHLELIAPVLGVALGDLFQATVTVPQAGEVTGGQGPPQAWILEGSGRPTTIGIKEEATTLSKMYCLIVADRSMVPTFPPDTHLIAQRETSENIKDENFVVYWGEDGFTYIRQIFIDGNQITLRSLTQGIPDKNLPIKHLTLCDKIVRINFS